MQRTRKILALGMLISFVLARSAGAESTPFSAASLSILLAQARVQQIQKYSSRTTREEDLEHALEELKTLGEGALNILNGPRNSFENSEDYERRAHHLIASVIAGFRYALSQNKNPAQMKAAAMLLELNRKLFFSLQRSRHEDLLLLQELTPLFVVLDPLAKNLRHPNAVLRAKSAENLIYLNQILLLMKQTYDFAPRDTSGVNAKTIESNLDLLSPYMHASVPALKQAATSADPSIQKQAQMTLNQIEALQKI